MCCRWTALPNCRLTSPASCAEQRLDRHALPARRACLSARLSRFHPKLNIHRLSSCIGLARIPAIDPSPHRRQALRMRVLTHAHEPSPPNKPAPTPSGFRPWTPSSKPKRGTRVCRWARPTRSDCLKSEPLHSPGRAATWCSPSPGTPRDRGFGRDLFHSLPRTSP